ncbi:putative protein ABIL5 [Sesamum alatum]|uniref:Uncharacterized protein n=1 Tax=Sesamum alatum TaxID=300844 RepID=A0AAE1XP75_9LAMI|nr:putative protein ABIL5 [Sesamum alatum]
MEEESKFLVDNATEFHKSLKELRELSSQLYHAADYWETAFMSSQDKRHIVETTKDYISGAVATLVDHVGSISAVLEYSISKTNSVPQAEHKIDTLKQRIGTCQQHSHRLALPRLHWTTHFSRFHSRYISLRLQDSAFMSAVCSVHRDAENHFDATGKEGNASEAKKPPFIDTDTWKPVLVECSNNIERKISGASATLDDAVRRYKHLLPSHDGALSISPKAEHSTFHFQVQEAQKVKRSMINWKVMKNKEIASLIRRGKQILA